MTPDHIIHARRRAVIEHAAIVGVTAACRAAGVSRKSYYQWLGAASKYGVAALMPKTRRPGLQPNATPAEEVSIILATAVAHATLGARQLLRHLQQAGVHRSASGVQKVLHRHHLGLRAQRLAALASLTAAEQGLVTDAAQEGPFGFCQVSTVPGQVVALESFYVGKLKGVGTIWQLTAVDIATRWSVCQLVVGDKGTAATVAFIGHLRTALAALGVDLSGVLTDNGPEFAGRAFTGHLREQQLAHHRIPPRSPNHNVVCERFHGTVLQEFYRPFFHRARIDRLVDLDAGLQRWLGDYNSHRLNHGAYMNGRTPKQVLTAMQRRLRQTVA